MKTSDCLESFTSNHGTPFTSQRVEGCKRTLNEPSQEGREPCLSTSSLSSRSIILTPSFPSTEGLVRYSLSPMVEYENRTKTPPSLGYGCSSRGLKSRTDES